MKFCVAEESVWRAGIFVITHLFSQICMANQQTAPTLVWKATLKLIIVPTEVNLTVVGTLWSEINIEVNVVNVFFNGTKNISKPDLAIVITLNH